MLHIKSLTINIVAGVAGFLSNIQGRFAAAERRLEDFAEQKRRRPAFKMSPRHLK
jgi:hypothetical protein